MRWPQQQQQKPLWKIGYPELTRGAQSSCVVRAHLRTLFLFSIEDITPNETTPVAELRESGNY